MKCEFCDKEANVFFTQVVNGKSKKMNMCETCAEEQGVTSLDDFKLADFLINDETPKMPDDKETPTNTTATNTDVSECTECGFTLENLRKIGRLGCSSCYSKFTSEITGMLKNMHRGVEHKGKVPTGMIDAINVRKKISGLKSALNKAIKSENYEKASTLRDELMEMEKL